MRSFILILIGLLMSSSLSALTFQTRLEKVAWQVEGDQFECRLMQPVTGFGSGGFVRRAGESARFQLHAHDPWFSQGSAQLVAAAAPWQPGRTDVTLGQVSVQSGDKVFTSSFEQAGRLLSGLLEGRSPLVQHRQRYGGGPLEVRLLPVRFEKAYQDYLGCTAKLLPVNFDQVSQMQLSFTGGDVELSEQAQRNLDHLLIYLKADPSVNHIQLDGHSDNSGDRLTNRELSRQRALAVQNYLVSKGIPAEQITLRFHGERYPLVPNNSKANRAKNRRVTLKAERVTPQPTPPSAPAGGSPDNKAAQAHTAASL
ncbi:OmpA family protein [Azomonas agilis]|uniref:OmpA family protein n=1 Tax=Azomonas agilis TaxID=116849 RepID=A0A562IZL4_9GAMM|nr:OmpA family protein [Azomonas agilis]TWH76481.1 OmpA family protein [Azomonas agilis]